MQTLPKILLIEDNLQICQALQLALNKEFHLESVQTGKQGLYRTDYQTYDAILLDLGLPDISGSAICQQLRERGITTPIVVLSGETKPLTKVTLLDLGANDYLTKPFSLGELKARLRLQLKQHTQRYNRLGKLQHEDIILDMATQQVTRAGRPVALRRKEFHLLACLLINKGSTVTRQALIDYAWQNQEIPWTNTLDVHIKHLRDKIDKDFDVPLIHTVHGVGYRLGLRLAQPVMTQR